MADTGRKECLTVHAGIFKDSFMELANARFAEI